ncbi:MAG TPA: hypothetical protein V6C82_09495, partial [Chroococcales cyanobacterium]
RASLGKLFSQYFQYGFWKVRVIKKHRRPASLRHLVPALFVLALSAALCESIVNVLPLLFLGGLYLGAGAIAAARISWRRPHLIPLLLLIFFVLHFSYGLGFLGGVLRSSSGRKSEN